MSLPEEFADALSRVGPGAGSFIRGVHWHASLPSTNDAAAALADAGAPEGTIVIADAQTAGRGRQGRPWASPAGAGLYVSIVLRPHAAAAGLVSIAAGVGLADGVEAAVGLAVTLKWPNDLYVGQRKLAGILAEAGSTGTRVAHVVLGFGINVLPASYPPEIAARATSLESELGRPVDRAAVLAACLSGLAKRYAALQAGERDTVIHAWRLRAAPTRGRAVEWVTASGRARGTVDGMDDDGALLVRTQDGLARVVSGEITWL